MLVHTNSIVLRKYSKISSKCSVIAHKLPILSYLCWVIVILYILTLKVEHFWCKLHFVDKQQLTLKQKYSYFKQWNKNIIIRLSGRIVQTIRPDTG